VPKFAFVDTEYILKKILRTSSTEQLDKLSEQYQKEIEKSMPRLIRCTKIIKPKKSFLPKNEEKA
jgi:Skp family chaperone for outer membrane proteins